MIDWSHVMELKQDMADGFDELVTIFLEEAEGGVQKLSSEAPPEVLAADFHFLKGAALNFGFITFAKLCSEGEQKALEGRGDTIDLASVRACYQKTRVDFLAGLDRRAA